MIRHMLISSSLFIVLILQVRVCLKNHIPGRIYVMRWEIALLRLVLPLKIPILPDRLLNHIDTFSPNTVSLTTENVGKRFFIIWGIGFSISFIIAVINYYRERMLLAQSLPIEIDFTKTENLYTVPIRVSDRILSPVVYGIWKPCVVLPKAMNYNNLKLLQNVLLHEKAHIFWKDNLVKSLSAFIFCLYWFDPFVWILYYFLSKDMEFACDEEAIRNMDYKNRKEYALCIYEMADYDLRFFSVANRFGGNSVKERIVKIMKFKKHTPFITILAVFFTITSALGVFASNENDNLQIEIIPKMSSREDNVDAPLGIEAESDFSDNNTDTDEANNYSVDGYELYPYYRTSDMTDEEVIEIEKLHEYNRTFLKIMKNKITI